jgi:hypothetical protein
VPLEVGEVGERRGLVAQLLAVVLAEDPLAGGVGRPHRLGRVRLGDGHQGDLARVAARAPRGRGQPGAHVREVAAQGFVVAVGHDPGSLAWAGARVNRR